ncbi:hypothetical protein [Actinomadura gamaensis]|uniref:Uncharacterized protein n=1 Tax=Actinomadura gamaensis TaxID=1763541 RepID=A0ABV9UBI5_9ACTN
MPKSLLEDEVTVVTPRMPGPVVAGDPTYDDEDWWDSPGEIYDDHDV